MLSKVCLLAILILGLANASLAAVSVGIARENPGVN